MKKRSTGSDKKPTASGIISVADCETKALSQKAAVTLKAVSPLSETNIAYLRSLMDTLLSSNVFDTVLYYHDYYDLKRILFVCKAWYHYADTEQFWRFVCLHVWSDKHFIPSNIQAWVVEGNTHHKRLDLERLTVKELRRRCTEAKLPDVAQCIEKQELISLWEQNEIKQYNAYNNEPLAKRALRLSIKDATRREITEEELCDLTFNIRLRGDGPLRQLLDRDPWWSDKGGNGEVKFSSDHKLTFKWPEDMNPFEDMMGHATLRWRLPSKQSSYVQLLFDGNRGPREYIARHPNWGWILVSGGTCWTSWPMPRRGTDAFIEDANISDLMAYGDFS